MHVYYNIYTNPVLAIEYGGSQPYIPNPISCLLRQGWQTEWLLLMQWTRRSKVQHLWPPMIAQCPLRAQHQIIGPQDIWLLMTHTIAGKFKIMITQSHQYDLVGVNFVMGKVLILSSMHRVRPPKKTISDHDFGPVPHIIQLGPCAIIIYYVKHFLTIHTYTVYIQWMCRNFFWPASCVCTLEPLVGSSPWNPAKISGILGHYYSIDTCLYQSLWPWLNIFNFGKMQAAQCWNDERGVIWLQYMLYFCSFLARIGAPLPHFNDKLAYHQK